MAKVSATTGWSALIGSAGDDSRLRCPLLRHRQPFTKALASWPRQACHHPRDAFVRSSLLPLTGMAIELSKKQKQTNGSACSLGTIVPVLALVAVGALAFALRQSRTENLALQARVVALGELDHLASQALLAARPFQSPLRFLSAPFSVGKPLLCWTCAETETSDAKARLGAAETNKVSRGALASDAGGRSSGWA